MTTEQQDSIPQAPVTGDGPGALLREAREARGISQQAVADSLNLRLTLVRDIELDRFDPRTASTFTRGYLRTYAKLVGADEAAVLQAYDSLGLGESKYAEMQSFSGRTKREANENRLRLISWLLFIGLAILMFVWWWQQPAEEPRVLSVDDASQQEPLVPMPGEDLSPEAALPEMGDSELSPVTPDAPVEPQAAPTEPVTVPLAPGQTPEPATPVTEPAAPAVEPVSPVPDQSSNETPTGSQTQGETVHQALITLRLSGDCWLKITDANGKVVLEGTKPAGSVQSVDGQPPFRVVLGAPQVVSISYQDQPVDMARYVKRGQVARFSLPLQS